MVEAEDMELSEAEDDLAEQLNAAPAGDDEWTLVSVEDGITVREDQTDDQESQFDDLDAASQVYAHLLQERWKQETAEAATQSDHAEDET